MRTRTPEILGQDRTGYDPTGPRRYDVAPDGGRFLVTKNIVEADHVPSLIFVENRIAEFREKNSDRCPNRRIAVSDRRFAEGQKVLDSSSETMLDLARQEGVNPARDRVLS